MRRFALVFGILASVSLCISFGVWAYVQEREIQRVLSVPIPNSPCFPPCWEGITPGKTSAEEALEIVTTLPTMQIRGFGETRQIPLTFDDLRRLVQEENVKGTIVWDWRSFPWWFGECVDCPMIYWDRGRVSAISLDVFWEVKDVIDLFGNPEGVVVVPGGVPEHWYWHVNLKYPRKGLSFGAVTAEYEHELRPDSKVMWGNYSTPWVVEDKDEILPWQGFGNVPALYGIP